jgi:hypothetical protein
VGSLNFHFLKRGERQEGRVLKFSFSETRLAAERLGCSIGAGGP